MVRTRPDIEEDQRPEVDDRQPVGIDRALGALRHEIIHHAEEARGEEEANRVMAVPPLGQRILHAGEHRIALGAEERHGDRQVVDDMQHGDRHDEGEVEPVGHVDVRLLAVDQGAEEHQEIGDPDDGEPQVDVPFGLGIFAALGDAHQIAGGRQHDEQLVAPEHEPGEIAEGQPHPVGALDHIEARGDQRVAAEGEDHGGGMQRPQPAEIEPLKVRVPGREGELQRDDDADQKAHDPPEHRGDGAGPHHAVEIARDIGFSGREIEGLRPVDDGDDCRGGENDTYAPRKPCHRPWRPASRRRAPEGQAGPIAQVGLEPPSLPS